MGFGAPMRHSTGTGRTRAGGLERLLGHLGGLYQNTLAAKMGNLATPPVFCEGN